MKITTHIFLTFCLLAALTSCNGMFDEIYDQAPADTAFEQGFRPADKGANRFTLMLDARNYEEWKYVSLKHQTIETIGIPDSLTGEWDERSGWTYNHVDGDKYTYLSLRKTDKQPEPSDWDLAIHHFDVRTNGAAVLATEYTSIDQLPASSQAFAQEKFTPDQWSSTQVITDLTGMMAYNIGYQNSYINPVLCQWATMDFSTPPPTYDSTGKVYIVRFADHSHAALHLRSYMSQAGTKGFLTIDVIYPY